MPVEPWAALWALLWGGKWHATGLVVGVECREDDGQCLRVHPEPVHEVHPADAAVEPGASRGDGHFDVRGDNAAPLARVRSRSSLIVASPDAVAARMAAMCPAICDAVAGTISARHVAHGITWSW